MLPSTRASPPKTPCARPHSWTPTPSPGFWSTSRWMRRGACGIRCTRGETWGVQSAEWLGRACPLILHSALYVLHSSRSSDVQLLDVPGVRLDELAAGFDLFAEEDAEDHVGALRVLD